MLSVFAKKKRVGKDLKRPATLMKAMSMPFDNIDCSFNESNLFCTKVHQLRHSPLGQPRVDDSGFLI
jgi:hypothetical protein